MSRNSTVRMSALWTTSRTDIDGGLLPQELEVSVSARPHEIVYVPLTLTRPVPWPIKPSDDHSRSYRQMHKPIFWMTRLAYFALMLFSIAMRLCFSNWDGVICTRSAILVW